MFQESEPLLSSFKPCQDHPLTCVASLQVKMTVVRLIVAAGKKGMPHQSMAARLSPPIIIFRFYLPSSQTISSLGKLLFYLLAIVLLLPSLEKLTLCKCCMAAAQ